MNGIAAIDQFAAKLRENGNTTVETANLRALLKRIVEINHSPGT